MGWFRFERGFRVWALIPALIGVLAFSSALAAEDWYVWKYEKDGEKYEVRAQRNGGGWKAEVYKIGTFTDSFQLRNDLTEKEFKEHLLGARGLGENDYYWRPAASSKDEVRLSRGETGGPWRVEAFGKYKEKFGVTPVEPSQLKDKLREFTGHSGSFLPFQPERPIDYSKRITLPTINRDDKNIGLKQLNERIDARIAQVQKKIKALSPSETAAGVSGANPAERKKNQNLFMDLARTEQALKRVKGNLETSMEREQGRGEDERVPDHQRRQLIKSNLIEAIETLRYARTQIKVGDGQPVNDDAVKEDDEAERQPSLEDDKTGKYADRYDDAEITRLLSLAEDADSRVQKSLDQRTGDTDRKPEKPAEPEEITGKPPGPAEGGPADERVNVAAEAARRAKAVTDAAARVAARGCWPCQNGAVRKKNAAADRDSGSSAGASVPDRNENGSELDGGSSDERPPRADAAPTDKDDDVKEGRKLGKSDREKRSVAVPASADLASVTVESYRCIWNQKPKSYQSAAMAEEGDKCPNQTICFETMSCVAGLSNKQMIALAGPVGCPQPEPGKCADPNGCALQAGILKNGKSLARLAGLWQMGPIRKLSPEQLGALGLAHPAQVEQANRYLLQLQKPAEREEKVYR